MSAETYLLCERQGRKWIAIAGTNSGGCLAASETVFAFYGLKGEATWGDMMRKQKNFGGYSPDYKAVELSDHARNLYWFREALKQPWYKSFDHFVQTFPDAEQYREQLTYKAP